MKRPFLSRRERAAVLRAVRAVAGLAILGGSAALALALATAHPDDNGFYHASSTPTQNWLGPLGATAADFLTTMLGVTAYGIAVFLGVWGLRVLFNAGPRTVLRRFFAAPPALLIVAALASAAAPTGLALSLASGADGTDGGAGVGAGGVLGDFIFNGLAGGLPFAEDWARRGFTAAGLGFVGFILTLIALGGSLLGAGRALRWTRFYIVIAIDRGVSALFGSAARAQVRREERRRARRAQRGRGPAFSEPVTIRRPTVFRRRATDPAPQTPLAAAPAAPRDDVDPAFGAFEPGFSGRDEDAADPPIDSAIHDAQRRTVASFSALDTVGDREAAFEEDDRFWRDDAASEADDPDPDWRDAAWADHPAPDLASQPELEPEPEPEPEPETTALPPRHARNRYTPPSPSLLRAADAKDREPITERMLAEAADKLEAVLADFGVRGQIIDVNPGPVVSQFELEPAPGQKAARVAAVADDLARSMGAASARVSTIPGRAAIGVELPNAQRETVRLREVLASSTDADMALPIALGKDITGAPMLADLAAMPHLLVAGATGSGKSVAINAMILSLLYRLTPDEARLLLIDPKMLELSVYNGAPHLLAPVVTDPRAAVSALQWTVGEMARRYRLMSAFGVRNLAGFNARISEAAAAGTPLIAPGDDGSEDGAHDEILAPLPRIVVVIDEMADLMAVAGKEIERCVQRLAQMARASGIHLIAATQRPSVDVLTGVIKANFPVRMSFRVATKVDSRTILDEGGAEQLLGKGDMLFTGAGGRLERIHGAFVSDAEIDAVVAHLRAQPATGETIRFGGESDADTPAGAQIDGPAPRGRIDEDADDALYAEALEIVLTEQKASTSFLQRRLSIGYNRAARLVERMEANGVVSPPNHVGKRRILARPPETPARDTAEARRPSAS